MKRIGNLYEQICSIENLNQADFKARKGKLKSYGVKRHDRNREQNIQQLHIALKKHTFKTSTYNIFKIYEPKERLIYQLPYYPDRIVHHAIMNILEPIWMNVFTADTYSCIKGRGIMGCARKVKKHLKADPEGTRYSLKLDIRKFYPNVDHAIMKAILRRKIKDKELLQLIDEIIDSADGVPIGNYLSQYLANLYLAYFDHWAKEQCGLKYYYRYADDIVVLHHDKTFLHNVYIKMKQYLHQRLKLEIKGNYQVFPVDVRGLDFVGYRFYHTHTLLRKRIKQNLCRRIAKINKKDLTPEQYRVEISAQTSWTKHCNSINLMNKITKHEEI
ncbi:MAG: RNA-directed DNA polymerase [Salinivirgaceae bacterium]